MAYPIVRPSKRHLTCLSQLKREHTGKRILLLLSVYPSRRSSLWCDSEGAISSAEWSTNITHLIEHPWHSDYCTIWSKNAFKDFRSLSCTSRFLLYSWKISKTKRLTWKRLDIILQFFFFFVHRITFNLVLCSVHFCLDLVHWTFTSERVLEPEELLNSIHEV